jgi:hypothetical protein
MTLRAIALLGHPDRSIYRALYQSPGGRCRGRVCEQICGRERTCDVEQTRGVWNAPLYKSTYRVTLCVGKIAKSRTFGFALAFPFLCRTSGNTGATPGGAFKPAIDGMLFLHAPSIPFPVRLGRVPLQRPPRACSAFPAKKPPTTRHHPTYALSRSSSPVTKAAATPHALGSSSIRPKSTSLTAESPDRYVSINGGGEVDVSAVRSNRRAEA